MELSKYIEGVRVACREEGWPLRPEIVDLVVDAWHKATKEATRAERERCVSRSLAIVNAILEDLTDRRGLSQEWEHIETEIQVEIINAWKDTCVAVLQETDDEV